MAEPQASFEPLLITNNDKSSSKSKGQGIEAAKGIARGIVNVKVIVIVTVKVKVKYLRSSTADMARSSAESAKVGAVENGSTAILFQVSPRTNTSTAFGSTNTLNRVNISQSVAPEHGLLSLVERGGEPGWRDEEERQSDESRGDGLSESDTWLVYQAFILSEVQDEVSSRDATDVAVYLSIRRRAQEEERQHPDLYNLAVTMLRSLKHVEAALQEGSPRQK